MIAQAHILLVHHKRINAWLPPGGHINQFELPHEAAVRETLEETGVKVEILSDPMPNTKDPEAYFLYSPLCLHAVKATEKGESFYHLDITYLCRPIRSDDIGLPPISPSTEEIHKARWVPLSETHHLSLAKNVPEILNLASTKIAQVRDENLL